MFSGTFLEFLEKISLQHRGDELRNCLRHYSDSIITRYHPLSLSTCDTWPRLCFYFSYEDDIIAHRKSRVITVSVKDSRRHDRLFSEVPFAASGNEGPPHDRRQFKEKDRKRTVGPSDVLRHVIALHSPRGNETLFGSSSTSSSSDSLASSSRTVRADGAATELIKLANHSSVSLFSTV